MTKTGTAGRTLVASVLGAVGVMLWATETSLINVARAVPPLQTVALAFTMAAATAPVAWLVSGADPLLAFRQPLRAWILVVGSLFGYHAAIYYATQHAPAAPAALLQGTTPLMIVVGSALLPGERLRWWHVLGAGLGFAGVSLLIEGDSATPDASYYLSIIGVSAAIWGLYSVLSRKLADVPTSTLGVFFAAAALLAFAAHVTFETWVTPTPTEAFAIAALGALPMGLAIYLWDFGCKHGDIQALGAFSYVEPFIGAVIVSALGQGVFGWSLIWSGVLVIGGAVIASSSLYKPSKSKHAGVNDVPDNFGIIENLDPSLSGSDLVRVIRSGVGPRAGSEVAPDQPLFMTILDYPCDPLCIETRSV